jgi:hypothetical protein
MPAWYTAAAVISMGNGMKSCESRNDKLEAKKRAEARAPAR